MSRKEMIAQTKARLERAKRNNDWFSITECEQLLSDLNRMTELEYASYMRVKKMYASNSVKPIKVTPCRD